LTSKFLGCLGSNWPRSECEIGQVELRIAAASALPGRDQPAHASPAAALAWCDTEQANLLHAQQAATDNERHDLSWQFADTLWVLRTNQDQKGLSYVLDVLI
jgi:hypothetical protein